MRKIFQTFIITIIVALALSGKSHALTATNKTDKVEASIVSQVNEINESLPFEVIVKFEMKDGWHIFAENPGDIGKPTEIKWDLPKGYEVTDVNWTIPSSFGDEYIVQYGYGDVAYYKATIVPAKTAQESVKFGVEIFWQACKDECIPERFSTNLFFKKTNVFPEAEITWNKIDVEAEQSFVEAHPNETTSYYALPLILIMAFVGGLILNFMPCIFPILTLKAISLVQGRYNHREMRTESILYMVGVIISFLSIASILVFFRARGENIGWGFQLQSPIFVCIILVIFFIVFLMLLDVITMKNPFANVGRMSKNKKRFNSFATGFFAVLIASPCTAPFMGIAIGYTLTQPIYIYYPVFLALSLGYALPFTMVGFFPKLLHKILPKPGRWMIVLKKIFAIPVFLTCIWLIWVLHSQMSFVKTETVETLKWEKYDQEVVKELVENNQPVFIDFTAKWCITCLANERFVLQSKSFAKMIEEKNIKLFKADWTNEDPKITRALEIYGRNSIPLYIIYDGKSNQYITLPQILTPQIVRDALKDI